MLCLLFSVSFLLLTGLCGMLIALMSLDQYMVGRGPGAIAWILPIMGVSSMGGAWLGYRAMDSLFYIHPNSLETTLVLTLILGFFTHSLSRTA